jgi:hypothetical protein
LTALFTFYKCVFTFQIFGNVLRCPNILPSYFITAMNDQIEENASVEFAVSIVPIVKVESSVAFALKIGGLVVIANVVGAGIFLAAKRSAREA